MYRDEESVAAEHAAEVQAELEALLAPRLAVARRLVPRMWHWFVAVGVLGELAYCESSPDVVWSNTTFWKTAAESPASIAAGLTVLATGLIAGSFFGVMKGLASYRARTILRRFGPPPVAMQATRRLPELQRRLLELRDLIDEESEREASRAGDGT